MSNVQLKASLTYLSQYMEINDDLIKAIEKHCKRYNLEPNICAWYNEMDDFYSDWCAIGYTKTEAKKIYHGGIGEFQTFLNGNIIRYVI